MKKEGNGLMSWLEQPQTRAMAVNVTRFLAVLLGVLALMLVIILSFALWPVLAGGPGIPLLHLLDELDDELEALLLLSLGAAVCCWASRALRRGGRAAAGPEE